MIQTRQFNWVRKQSAWEQTQAWRARRQQMQADFRLASSAVSAGLAAAWSNQITGTANLAASAALERINAATALARTLDKSV